MPMLNMVLSMGVPVAVCACVCGIGARGKTNHHFSDTTGTVRWGAAGMGLGAIGATYGVLGQLPTWPVTSAQDGLIYAAAAGACAGLLFAGPKQVRWRAVSCAMALGLAFYLMFWTNPRWTAGLAEREGWVRGGWCAAFMSLGTLAWWSYDSMVRSTTEGTETGKRTIIVIRMLTMAVYLAGCAAALVLSGNAKGSHMTVVLSLLLGCAGAWWVIRPGGHWVLGGLPVVMPVLFGCLGMAYFYGLPGAGLGSVAAALLALSPSAGMVERLVSKHSGRTLSAVIEAITTTMLCAAAVAISYRPPMAGDAMYQ